MQSPRRCPSGAHRSDLLVGPRRLIPGGAVLLAAMLVLLLGVAPAGAQPAPPVDPAPPAVAPPAAAPPTTAADAVAQLDTVGREAEVLTEQWHAAQDDLAARRTELETMRAAVEPTRRAVDVARGDEQAYRLQVDAMAMSTFESGRLDQFNALLASGSPQEYLDQMSALEMLSADYADSLKKLSVVVDTTSRAQAAADAAAALAQTAADEATRAEQELGVRKREAEVRIDEAERLLRQLSPQQRRDRNGPVEAGPIGPVTGSGVGVKALVLAITQIGKPYQWGAAGPNSFDCSGLMSWAFKQVGVTLPRSSSQQARVGRAVSIDELQPGDLIFSYFPVSHVGIYAGGGKMLAAPQTGDVVKYQKVPTTDFNTARRL